MILWLVLFFPYGLYLLWCRHPELKKKTKIIVTAAVIVIALGCSTLPREDSSMAETTVYDAHNSVERIGSYAVTVSDSKTADEAFINEWYKTIVKNGGYNWALIQYRDNPDY